MSASAWSDYWRSGATRGCLPGASEAVQKLLARQWQDFAKALPPGAAVLDLACGAGAVMQAMAAVRPDLQLTGVDNAELPAGDGLNILSGVDCGKLPFANGSFEAVTSQYGLEYCPDSALAEAARVLTPGGQLLLVIHASTSAPVRHNSGRLAAMQALDSAGLFRLARQSVAGFRDPALAAAVTVARVAHQQQGIARELPLALEQARAAPRPLDQISQIEARARGEMERLAAMAAAALGREEIDTLVQALREAGVSADATSLVIPGGDSLGWRVFGKKMGA